MSVLNIWDKNQTFVEISADDQWIIEEFSNYFTFDVPGAQFSSKVRYGLWDGRKRLFRRADNTIYRGLIPQIKEFCKDREIACVVDPDISDQIDETFDPLVFCDQLDLIYKPFDYQYEAIRQAISNRRKIIRSPTNSGKSLIIYAIIRFLIDAVPDDQKILLMVPRIQLVEQLFSDFEGYNKNFDIERYCHRIYQGKEKHTNKKIHISTWQSLKDLPASYFKQFGAILSDEVHELEADCAKKIFENSTNASWRFGFTGTLKKTETHVLILQGLTGQIFKATSSKELIDRGISSQLHVKCVVLQHTDEDRKKVAKMSWQEENAFICNHPKRTKVISDLVCLLTKTENCLVLSQSLDQVAALAESLKKAGKKVYTITGKVKLDKRQDITALIEQENGIVVICTFGVFSTGINVKNLQHLLFANNGKAEVRLLQSIGRLLRLDGKSNKAMTWDIVDDLCTKARQNYAYKHFFERIAAYASEKFKYSIKKIRI